MFRVLATTGRRSDQEEEGGERERAPPAAALEAVEADAPPPISCTSCQAIPCSSSLRLCSCPHPRPFSFTIQSCGVTRGNVRQRAATCGVVIRSAGVHRRLASSFLARSLVLARSCPLFRARSLPPSLPPSLPLSPSHLLVTGPWNVRDRRAEA